MDCIHSQKSRSLTLHCCIDTRPADVSRTFLSLLSLFCGSFKAAVNEVWKKSISVREGLVL